MQKKILTQVRLTDRTPVKGDRYFIEQFGGHRQVKRWLPRTLEFSRVFGPLVEYWYDEFELPDVEDAYHLVANSLPSHLHEMERALILEGARRVADILKTKLSSLS